MNRKLKDTNYINREISWIKFNERVLEQALDKRTPLIEQVKFTSIFSNNLDEFFMVRVASLKSQVEAGVTKQSEDEQTPAQQLITIGSQVRPLLRKQQDHFNKLKINLKDEGILLMNYENLNSRQKIWVENYFKTTIFPVLTPLAVDPAHPFPFVSNLSLNIAALIKDPDTDKEQFTRVKVPGKTIDRLIIIPNDLSEDKEQSTYSAIPLEEIVAFNLNLLL